MIEPRTAQLVMDETASVADHASVVKMQEQMVVGYVGSERAGVLMGADQVDFGDMAARISGEPRQGESGMRVAAPILVSALNAQGATRSPVTLPDDPTDCEALP